MPTLARATRRLVRLPLLLAPVVLLACGDDLGPRVPAAIVVTPESPRVLLGGTLQLTATVVDASGRELSDQPVTFESSDVTVLTVDDAGLLTSVGSTGGSLITVASGDLTTEVDATVVLPPSALVVSPSSLELDTGELNAIAVTVTDENGQPVPDAEIAFEGSAPAIIQVDTLDEFDGHLYVTGLAVGSATITVTSGALSADVAVTVAQIPTAVAITPPGLVLSSGGSQQVTAALLDRTGEAIVPPQPFTWSSSDEALVTVSPTGLVTSVGPEGSALITATTDTFTASLGVLVGTAPAGEMLDRLPFLNAEGVAVAPGGEYFVTGSDLFARGTLPDFAFPVQVPISGSASDIVVNGSVTRAYLIGAMNDQFEHGVAVMDLATNTQVDFIPVGLGSPWSGALSGDGSVLTVGTDHGFELIDVATKASLGGTAVGFVNRITHHPLQPLLYASSDRGVFELDPKSGEIIRRFPGSVSSHAVTPDGTRLYTVDISGGIGVWNLETGLQEESFASVRGTDLAISPDGRFLYVLFGSDHIVDGSRVSIVDPATGAPLRTVILGGLARRIAMSSDGIAVISNFGGDVGWVDFVR